MTQKHTPLPLRVKYSHPNEKDTGRVTILTAQNERVCDEVTKGDWHFGREMDRAKFITRACNSHYELVEKLEAALKHIEGAIGIMPNSDTEEVYLSGIEALKKVKGE